jgi:hypothetical protein
VKIAVPLVRVIVPNVLPLSLKAIDPVALEGLTVAVNVTGWPLVARLGTTTMVVEVRRGSTVKTNGVDTLDK